MQKSSIILLADTQDIKMWLQDDDIMIVDRGFRDSAGVLSNLLESTWRFHRNNTPLKRGTVLAWLQKYVLILYLVFVHIKEDLNQY